MTSMKLAQKKRRKMKCGKIKRLYFHLGKEKKESIIEKEFELSLMRSVLERVDRGFIKTYKPIIDDVPYRFFNRMEDYNIWCNKELPRWLGYGKTKQAFYK